MRRLLWIGSPFFSQSLKSCGFEVHVHNFEQPAVFGWDDLVRLAGWEPDVLVVADKSRPPFVLGMEDFPCITVFYGVDSHIHGWFPWYAQGFDLCLLSLYDHLASIRGRRLPDERVIWSPAFAPDLAPEDALQIGPLQRAPEWDVLFVGTVSDNTPIRRRFLDLLGIRLSGVQVMRGNYKELYPRARVVLNICEHGDLNFRVFEALGCGAPLVTPRIGHGFSSLFREGEHLAVYSPVDAQDEAKLEEAVRSAENVIRHLLADPAYRNRLAANGLREVNIRHRAMHRAKALSGLLNGLPSNTVALRRKEAENIRKQWLRLFYLLLAKNMPLPLLVEAYTNAALGRFC